MVQNIITWIIVAAAVVWIVKRIYDRISGRENDCGCGEGTNCSCGCDKCSMKE